MKFLSTIAAGILGALVVMNAAHAANGVTPVDIASILERFKFPVQFGVSEAGSPTIETDFGDLPTTLQFGDCDGEPTTCLDIAFIATFDDVEAPPLVEILKRNTAWLFVRHFLDASGVPGVEMDVTFVSGDPDLRFSAAIDIWREIAGALADGYPADPGDEVMADEVLDSAMTTSPPKVEALLGRDDSIAEDRRLKIVNIDTLAEIFGDLGHETRRLEGDDSRLWVTIDGMRVLAGVQLCHIRMQHCGAMTFFLVRPLEPIHTPQILNDFNITEWFIAAIPYDEKQLVLTMEVLTFDGLSRTDMARYIDIWKANVDGFDAFVKDNAE